jgi:DNA-binding CsgD family transcriptional regulator
VAVRAVSMIACGRLVAAAQLGPAVDAIIGQLHDVVTARGDYAENLLPIYRWPTMYSAARLIAEPQQRRALMAALAGGRAAWASAGDGAALMIVPRETARVDHDAGRWDDARAGLAVAEGISRELGENRSLWWVVADIAQLAAARGLEGECRACSAELDTVGEGTRSYRLGFFSGFPGTGALGLLALGRREYEEAVEEYERALLPRLGPMVALETFESLAAVPWAEHAATELRATGERLRRRTDPDASQLTPQELQVALLVARGASNKEAAAQLYLSPKTIEKHLGSTYTKLGLRSRTELARVFAAEPAAAAGVAG